MVDGQASWITRDSVHWTRTAYGGRGAQIVRAPRTRGGGGGCWSGRGGPAVARSTAPRYEPVGGAVGFPKCSAFRVSFIDPERSAIRFTVG